MRQLAFAALLFVTPGLRAQEDPHAALLAADRAAAEASSRCGLACGLGGALTADAFYLHNGAPIIRGGEAARAFLMAQPTLATLRIQWQALHAEVSSDGSFGVTWGVTTIGIRGGQVRFGRYISVWRHDDSGWRMAAHVQTGLNPSARLPEGWTAPLLPSLEVGPAVVGFVEADRAFAALAAQTDAANAFESFAASDAVTFAGPELSRGPTAIRKSLEGGPPETWKWGPVGAGSSSDGSLGFTVGDAIIQIRNAGGDTTVVRSKYLTVWRREPDGRARFIIDAGNALPPS
jgi:ketosteroid isomerase-like protein